MPTRLALGTGDHANLQVISLDVYTSRPALDYQSSRSASWLPASLPNPNGMQFKALSAGNGNDLNLQVVMLGATDGKPYLYWQDSSTGGWTGPQPLVTGPTIPSSYNAVLLAPGADGQLQALLLGADDNQPYVYWQNASSGVWSGPTPLSSTNLFAGYSALAAGRGPGGSLQVIALMTANQTPVLYSQNSAGAWSGPQSLLTSTTMGFSALAAGNGNDGNLQVILLGLADSQPYLLWQDASTGTWTGPTPLLGKPFPGGFSNVTIGAGNEGNLQVILIANNDGQPYLCWQAAGNGIWSGLAPLLPGITLPRVGDVAALPAYSAPDGTVNLQVILRAAGENSLRLAWQQEEGNWRYYGRLSSPTWMQDLATSIDSQPLNRVRLPGTHDSTTYGITSDSPPSPDKPPIVDVLSVLGGPGGIAALSAIPGLGLAAAAIAAAVLKSKGDSIIADWAVAQTFTTAQQLRAGVRYLDLRIGKTGSGEIWTMHALFSVPLANVLTNISSFLAEHTQEIVILDFNAFGGFATSDYATVKHALQQQFGSLLASSASLSPTSTVQQFLNAGARIVVVWRPSYDSSGASLDQSPASPQIWTDALQSNWPATADLTELKTKLDSYVAAPPAGQFFVLQGIFTPDNATIAEGILGSPSNLRELAQTPSPAVTGWLPNWSYVNIVIIDHVEDYPGFIEKTIMLNQV